MKLGLELSCYPYLPVPLRRGFPGYASSSFQGAAVSAQLPVPPPLLWICQTYRNCWLASKGLTRWAEGDACGVRWAMRSRGGRCGWRERARCGGRRCVWARDGRSGREVGDAGGVSEHGVVEGDACGHGGRCVWRGGRSAVVCERRRCGAEGNVRWRAHRAAACAQMWRGGGRCDEGGHGASGAVRRGGVGCVRCGDEARRYGGAGAWRRGGREARRHAGRARGREMRWRFGREPREGVSAVWRRAMRGEKRCEVDETRACGAVRSMRA